MAGRRHWTADQDQILRLQAAGQFSLRRAETLLKTGRETVIARMLVLGLEPVISHSNQAKGSSIGRVIGKPVEEAEPEDIFNACPRVSRDRNGNDKLLKQLQRHHRERLVHSLVNDG